MKRFSLKLFNALAIIASICACVDRNVAGGISEETEGVVAITDKTIAGVSQKGPFAKGSSVYLKETKADGSLTPTAFRRKGRSPRAPAFTSKKRRLTEA